MNVDPSSERFTEVVAWDSLTSQQQQSGDWILLPDVSNEPRRARCKTAGEKLREAFGPPSAARAVRPAGAAPETTNG